MLVWESESESCSVVSDSLRSHGLYSRWISPGQNTAFPFSRGSSQPRDRTQVSCIAGRFFTSWATRGSPRILEWVAYPFSRGSLQPRNWTGFSCIAGRVFTNWAIREAQWEKISKTSKKANERISGGPVVKTLPSKAGDVGLILGWETNIPHAVGQLRLGAATTEARVPQLESLCALESMPQQEKPVHCN